MVSQVLRDAEFEVSEEYVTFLPLTLVSSWQAAGRERMLLCMHVPEIMRAGQEALDAPSFSLG